MCDSRTVAGHLCPRHRSGACGMRIESSGHSQGNPRLYELVEHAPKTGKSPTVWAWPELMDYLKIAGQPVAGPWPPHQEPRPDPDYESLPVAVRAPEPGQTPNQARQRPSPEPDPGRPRCATPPPRDTAAAGQGPGRALEDRMYPSRFRYEAPRS